jgi:hypothetical protein
MSNENYPGLDYSGLGSTINRDPETGIRYGVISQHSIMAEVMSDIWDNSEDLSHKAAVTEMKKTLAGLHDLTDDCRDGTIAHAMKDIGVDEDDVSELQIIAEDSQYSGLEKTEAMWDVIEQWFNDRYECDSRDWLWEEDGYRLENCLQSDVFVSVSPFFTFAQFCSPCVPGAGNLDHPFEGKQVPEGDYPGYGETFRFFAEAAGWPKVFCLGHDFFEGEKAPYEVFSVADGSRVAPKEVA